MWFKKGSKVEVLRDKSSGAWYSAEIISSSGRTYSVQYDYISIIKGEAVVERVSRKAIRPIPPAESLNDLMAGDLTEAFTFGAWKIAVILKVLSGDHYLVRLVGSLEELSAHKSKIRVRQSWQNEKWFVTGKMDSRLPYIDMRSKLQEGIGMSFQDRMGLEVSNLTSPRKLKRVLSCSSRIGTYPKTLKRAKKEGACEQYISGSSFRLSNKVDAGDVLLENLGAKYLKLSFNNETADYRETGKKDTYGGGISFFPKRNRKAVDYNSDICSVGSCSVIDNSSDPRLHGCISAGTSMDAVELHSEAESSHGCGNEEESSYVPTNGDEREKIHRLELNAYRSLLVALHANGALSWEQEALLTNLRPKLGACMPCFYWSEDDNDKEICF